ncbi:hypothetical protein J2Y41_001301 [Arthrobacter sp. 1088]|nr:hypothetical protein [Arthrobacter sp. 1088]
MEQELAGTERFDVFAAVCAQGRRLHQNYWGMKSCAWSGMTTRLSGFNRTRALRRKQSDGSRLSAVFWVSRLLSRKGSVTNASVLFETYTF